ncbi:hypothetical protein PMIN01_10305, partial [Paraphaeosphaeria minitans]
IPTPYLGEGPGIDKPTHLRVLFCLRRCVRRYWYTVAIHPSATAPLTGSAPDALQHASKSGVDSLLRPPSPTSSPVADMHPKSCLYVTVFQKHCSRKEAPPRQVGRLLPPSRNSLLLTKPSNLHPCTRPYRPRNRCRVRRREIPSSVDGTLQLTLLPPTITVGGPVLGTSGCRATVQAAQRQRWHFASGLNSNISPGP